MEDPNLIIAWLIPASDSRESLEQTLLAIRLLENQSRYVPSQGDIEQEHGSRETTVSREDHDEGHVPNYTSHPGLQLTFNHGPKSRQGFVIGSNRDYCDIVLPSLQKISRRHCSLTFDAERRLILRDFSTNGTTVTYDGNGEERRKDFTWILSDKSLTGVEKIVIQIQKIKFQIIVSRHEANPALYNKKIDQFRQHATVGDELLLGGLGIQSTASTIHQSGTHTPRNPIFIHQGLLGTGSYSIVRRVWDVSTGCTYAIKEIFNMKESQWRREVTTLRRLSQLSNEHIVHFVGLIENSSPQFILEFVPLGNLEVINEQQRITNEESLELLCQSLNALTSIHQEDIVHRDIKPENILIQSRYPFHIKLSDFGFSKETTELKTFCGTHLYAAPEIYTTQGGAYYTKACDIWSLGVVVFKYAYGPLPKFHERDKGIRWCDKLIKKLNDWDSDPLVEFLSTAMLLIGPESRLSTRKCWEQALQISSNPRCVTPTQASYLALSQSREKLNPNLASYAGVRESGMEQANDLFQGTSLVEDHGNTLASTRIPGCLLPDFSSPIPPEAQNNCFSSMLPKPLGELSSRSIRHDPQGLKYIVIRGTSVAINIAENKIDATAICNVSGLDKTARDKVLKPLRRQKLVTIKGRPKHTWISVEEGVKLCQKLNMFQELKMLLSQEKNGPLKSQRNQEKLLGDCAKPPRSNGSKTTAVHATTDTIERTATLPDGIPYSQLTEQNGEYGSFFPPPDRSDSIEHTAILPDGRPCSQFTEPNGEYGSFLAPSDKSYLQLVEGRI